MTFYEAAVEVLRRTGRPLHFKKITEVAIRDELLSHVGKTPETTMEDRLDQETKKDDASWIVRTRPGVYTLKPEMVEQLNEEARKRDEAQRAKREARRQAESEPEDEESEAEEDEALDEASDADDSEETDDSDDSGEEEAESSDQGRGRGRRRRRRRRGGKEGSQDDDSGDSKSGNTKSAGSGKKESRSRRGRGRGNRGSAKKSSNKRSSAKSDTKRSSRSTSRSSSSSSSSFAELDEQRFDSIADAAFAVLNAASREAMTAADIAEIVFDKKLVRFHTHDAEATVQSAIVTDNQVNVRLGRRPLFAQYREGRWGLTAWGVSDEGIEKEQEILSLAEELRDEALDQLGDAVVSLKAEAFEMVVMTLLERLYYKDLKVSKRTSDGDVFFTADWQRGFSDMRVCIQIVSDSKKSLKKDAIVELRETLEHYSASEGIVIHLGPVAKDAVRESRDDKKAKVTVIDRKAFVRLLVDEGIGVKSFQVPLVMVDRSFVDALQS